VVTSPLAITIFVVGLIASIMIHEWGHFWTARRFGMRADRFFLGFGPTLWSTHVGETEYGVKAIPAGGFVRILGMTPTDARRPPVPDALLDPEALATDRRVAAAELQADVFEVPALPEPTWRRLDALLAERGTPRSLRALVLERTRRNLDEHATSDDVRAVLSEVLITETPDETGPGSLRHRLVRGDDQRFFHDRPAWQRAIVLSAGSAMHFVIAFALLLAGLLMIPQATGEVTPSIGAFTEDSVGAAAGLEEGDRILAVAGTRTEDFETIREIIRSRPGEPTEIVVERNGEELTIVATPARSQDPESGEYIGVLGFYPDAERVRLSPGEAVYETFVGPSSVPVLMVRSGEALVNVFGPRGIGVLFQQVAGDAERDHNGGVSIVGAAAVTGQAVELVGGMSVILMLVGVNVFIGIFNLLPLPPLDGGHLAVLGVERSVNAVRRRRGRVADYKVDPRAIAAIALPVIVLFGVVSLALIWLDITNPIVIN
jgi:regulator of sigma E protease